MALDWRQTRCIQHDTNSHLEFVTRGTGKYKPALRVTESAWRVVGASAEAAVEQIPTAVAIRFRPRFHRHNFNLPRVRVRRLHRSDEYGMRASIEDFPIRSLNEKLCRNRDERFRISHGRRRCVRETGGFCANKPIYRISRIFSDQNSSYNTQK